MRVQTLYVDEFNCYSSPLMQCLNFLNYILSRAYEENVQAGSLPHNKGGDFSNNAVLLPKTSHISQLQCRHI
jgi:hypothetical protein